jgi:hypothetical protein
LTAIVQLGASLPLLLELVELVELEDVLVPSLPLSLPPEEVLELLLEVVPPSSVGLLVVDVTEHATAAEMTITVAASFLKTASIVILLLVRGAPRYELPPRGGQRVMNLLR